MFLGLAWAVRLGCRLLRADYVVDRALFFGGRGIILVVVILLVVKFWYQARWRGQR